MNNESDKTSFTNLPNLDNQSNKILNSFSQHEPSTVEVRLNLWSISQVSAKNMEMEADVYVQLKWYVPKDVPLNTIKWRPSVAFRNCRGCTFLDFSTLFPRYDKDTHQVKVSIRALERFSCIINLVNYPFDDQHCTIQLQNYRQKSILVSATNNDQEMTVLSKMSLAEYAIEQTTQEKCASLAHGFVTGNNSCVQLVVLLRRRSAHHVITIFAPTTLAVAASWIAFWLPSEASSPRISLGIMSLLTIMTFANQAQSELPPVSYTKAVDRWLMACVASVAASLVESAIAVNVSIHSKHSTSRVTPQEPSLPNPQEALPILRPTFPLVGDRCDVWSRVLFPLTFAAFNVVYWSVYIR